MFDDFEEMIERLDEILEYVDNMNRDDAFHHALECGHQFREELRANQD